MSNVPSPDPLARVKRAARRNKQASREYREALLEAHTAGASFAEIARVAGTSRQNVRQVILRGSRP
jgi:DNA-directed RNA polymerase specialized sigma24 family protein